MPRERRAGSSPVWGKCICTIARRVSHTRPPLSLLINNFCARLTGLGAGRSTPKPPFPAVQRVKICAFISLFECFCYTKKSNFVDWVIPFLYFWERSRTFSRVAPGYLIVENTLFTIEHFLLKTKKDSCAIGLHSFLSSRILLENFYGTFTSKITGSIRTIWPYRGCITCYSGFIPSSSFCLASVDQFPLMDTWWCLFVI